MSIPAIRVAIPADLSRLAEIHALCFEKSWTEHDLRELLENPGTTALVAPGGFVMTRVASDEAEILTLAVTPAARSRGLGRLLLGEAARLVHERGARRMFLEVADANLAARALYASAGFTQAGRRKAYYDPGTDALVLHCDLPISPTSA